MLALIAVAAMVAQASGDASPPAVVQPAPGDYVTKADWVARPTGEDLARLYPKKAQRVNLWGSATIQCTVAPDGKLADCKAVHENPEGVDFADATLQLAPLFKMQLMDRDGRSTVGRPVRIPVRWVTLGGPRAKPISVALPGLSGHVELDCRAGGSGYFDNCLVLQTSGGMPLSNAAIEVVTQVKVPAGTPPWLRVTFPIDVTAAPSAAK